MVVSMNDSHAPTAIAMSCLTGKGLNALTEPFGDSHSVFLIPNLLAADIEAHPERLRAVEPDLVTRIASRIGGVDVDFNAPLLADDE